MLTATAGATAFVFFPLLFSRKWPKTAWVVFALFVLLGHIGLSVERSQMAQWTSIEEAARSLTTLITQFAALWTGSCVLAWKLFQLLRFSRQKGGN